VRCPVCGAPTAILYRGAEDLFFESGLAVDYARCQSASCRTLVQTPLPTADAISRFYSSYYTHARVPLVKRLERTTGARLLALRHASHRRSDVCAPLPEDVIVKGDVVLDVGAVLAPRRSSSVLDVGCGNGENLAMLSAWGFSRASGVEWDERACEAARSLGFEVRAGSAEAIPYEDASQDFVFLRHVIEHVLDLDRALSEVRRVLRQGGLVTFLTPNAQSRMHARFGRAWRGLEAPRHLRIFTPPSLAAVVARAGLEVVRVGANDRSARWIAARSEAVLARVATRDMPHLEGDPTIPRGEEVFVIARAP
jgi:SAM-dependent methyltransferase